MDRLIQVEGGFNVRDLGGYATSDGRVTNSRVLIRAGNLDKITPAAQQQLLDYGVKTIIDLRDEWEVQEFPNVFAQSKAVKYAHLPLIPSKLSDELTPQTDQLTTLHEVYSTYLERCQPQIGAIFTAIAESESTTIFHCYAGKDRTGIVAALILSAVGVTDSVIAEDYAETTPHIAHLMTGWREYAVKSGQDMQRFERNIGAEAQTIIGMLAALRERYGGAASYLEICGVGKGQVGSLRSHLIQPSIGE
jgi:protein-tyrosine phosphatase